MLKNSAYQALVMAAIAILLLFMGCSQSMYRADTDYDGAYYEGADEDEHTANLPLIAFPQSEKEIADDLQIHWAEEIEQAAIFISEYTWLINPYGPASQNVVMIAMSIEDFTQEQYIVIHLEDYSTAQIELFRQTVFDAPFLRFRQSLVTRDEEIARSITSEISTHWNMIGHFTHHSPAHPLNANIVNWRWDDRSLPTHERTIIVYLIDNSEVQIALFREVVVDSPFMRFYQYDSLADSAVGLLSNMDADIQHLIGFVRIEGNTLYLDRVELIITESIRDGFDSNPMHSLYSRLGINYALFPDLHAVNAECWIRMANLGIARDILSGYFVHHPHRTASPEILSFEFTDETTFIFTDVQLLFVTEPSSDRLYTTSCFDEFMQFFSQSGLSTAPYFISVRNGKVLSFHEMFLLTQ